MHLLREAWFAYVAIVVAYVVLVALGIFVLRLKPRTGASKALGIFAIAGGANYIVAFTPLFLDIDLSRPGYLEGYLVLRTILRAISAGGVVAMMLTFPRTLPRAERRVLIGPAIFGTLWVLALAAPRQALPPWVLLNVGTAIALSGFVWAYLLLLALRWRRTIDPAERHQLALAFAALALGVSFQAGAFAREASEFGSPGVLTFLAQLAPPVWLAVIWLRGAHGAQARVARDLALLPLAVAFIPFLIDPQRNSFDIAGFLLLVTVAILTYAIVRHQVLGIDVKLRFAISRSTVAAVFIAAFFVASEGAQILFGAGNEWVGLAAAGALVFAIAPLQRAAERLAERAVPHRAGPVPSVPATEVEARALRVYERALRAAIGDGRITRDEEDHLAHIAHEMGIPHPEALRMRRAIESEHEEPARRAGGEMG